MPKLKEPIHYTNQEIFDLTLAHCVRQGRMSEEYAVCSYRSEQGLKCAIGYWIPEHLYDTTIEGSSVSTLYDHEHAVAAYLGLSKFAGRAGLMGQLQVLHDDDKSWAIKGGVSEYFWGEAERIARANERQFDRTYIEQLAAEEYSYGD
jgi:hypothetical protein